MKPHSDLKQFLKPYDPSIQELTLALRDYLLNLVPQSNELIWDNYNAVAMAYSKSEKLKDAFCHIAVYSKHVNFGFNRGAELSKRNIKLNGNGKLIRHIKINAIEDFQSAELDKMVFEALAISEKGNEDLKGEPKKPKSMVMSISKKKIRPKKS